MELENLKPLGWLLLWGAVIFLMMRYGCGAHVTGHGRHTGHGGGGPPGTTVKDPVCGMDVDPQHAGAAAVYKGVTYYFCSTAHRDQFEQDPQRYLGRPAEGGTP